MVVVKTKNGFFFNENIQKFEPEDKVEMGSCLQGVHLVFNDLSDGVWIV